MERKIVYFEDIKLDNTETTFELAQERIRTMGIKKLVLASTTGATAKNAIKFFKDTEVKLVIVPHQFDFYREDDLQRKENLFPKELVKTLKELGHDVYFGTMLFHTDNLFGSKIPSLIANVLRCFCQGVKVCFEMVLMTTDAGLLTSGEKVIVIAGTVRGADTALVMQAASSQNFKKLRVNEIICMPYN
jgi:uncharacterized protein